MWAAFAPTACAVDSEARMRLEGKARAAEFESSRSCLEQVRDALPDTGLSAEHAYVRSMVEEEYADVLVETGELEIADSIAARELRWESREPTPNAGNIEYNMHQVLGRVALRVGRRVDAVTHLRQSTETSGSPQLSSWGPRLVLARELLEVGYREPVLNFLEDVRRFWTGPAADSTIAEAMHVIESGRIPDGPRWR
jgi:hypothetical protein